MNRLENTTTNQIQHQCLDDPFDPYLDIDGLERELGICITEYCLDMNSRPYVLFEAYQTRGAVVADTWDFRCLESADHWQIRELVERDHPSIDPRVFETLKDALRSACCLAY